jgi:molybdopterin-guanine dinucleotide biosynthesis protein A
MTTPPISGFVLAGGRSSRMGADKALLSLAGRPLIDHAVSKLRRVCTQVHILGSDPALAAYAPLIADLHPNCGPIGGMEAALANSPHPWNLFLAVDMPFLPAAFIYASLNLWLQPGSIQPEDRPPIHLFTADDRPQPGFCLLHQSVAPFLSEAIAGGDLKLMRVFAAAGRELALRRNADPASGLWKHPASSMEIPSSSASLPAWCTLSPAQRDAQRLWFTNLNTPEDFAAAEAHADALDL